MSEKLNSTIGELSYDHLFVGGAQNVVVKPLMVKQGESYVKGSVVALDDNGLAVLVDSNAAVESERKPYGVLTDNVDATAGEVGTTAYMTGEFNQDVLVFGGSDTYETHRQALRDIGIFIESIQKL